jgi:nitrogen regulatory protein PII
MKRKMTDCSSLPNFALIYVIVNYGMASRVLQKAKKIGVSGSTIFLGKGTVNNSLLNFLCLYDERKEIILMGTDQYTADRTLDELKKDFRFDKPNHGVIFTTNISDMIGSRCCPGEHNHHKEMGANQSMYQLIITIVNRGKAEDVIEAARAAGANGGTIVNARGSGVNETSKLFNMEIEPEKEMVMIIANKEITKNIVSSIREKLEIDKPGKGIVFIQDIKKAYGIFESTP